MHATTIYLCTGPVFRPSLSARPSSSAQPSPDLLLAVIVGPALGSSSRLVIIDKYERDIVFWLYFCSSDWGLYQRTVYAANLLKGWWPEILLRLTTE